MEDNLNIYAPIVYDESVEHIEVHAYQPITGAFYNNNAEIRILIQHQDLKLLISKSQLHLSGRLCLTSNENVANTKLVNNAGCHLFEEIRYEMNAREIDRCKNVGLTSTMKGWASFNPNQSLNNAGFTDVEEETSLIDANGYFDITIPLSFILGFAEDYRKIVVNAKHELILRRSNSDLNAVIQTGVQAQGGGNAATWESFKIELSKVEWLVPHVQLSNEHKIRLLNQLQKDRSISMSFRSWELYEYPTLPASAKHVWSVKTSNQLEKPRYVILAFQTKRKNQKDKNASRFDHCNIQNVKLFLNSQQYPYGNLNLNIARNQYSILYDMFVHFQNSYYVKDPEPILTKKQFIDHIPLIVIDCSKQNESLKSAPVDVRLEFEAGADFPENTTAYCLIIHDRIVEYNPMSGDVRIVT